MENTEYAYVLVYEPENNIKGVFYSFESAASAMECYAAQTFDCNEDDWIIEETRIYE